MTQDMTSGKPLKLIVKFFIPLMLGSIFQQFYSMVDAIVVGKFVGVNALAGVGATGSLNFLIIGFATGVCSGFAIMFGQSLRCEGLFADAPLYCQCALFGSGDCADIDPADSDSFKIDS